MKKEVHQKSSGLGDHGIKNRGRWGLEVEGKKLAFSP